MLSCKRIGDAAVRSLASAESCSGLRVLDLGGCRLLTDEALIALANGCSGGSGSGDGGRLRLEKISVSGAHIRVLVDRLTDRHTQR